MVGTRQRVLVTGPAARDARELCARTDNNRVVNFAGARELIGTYADVTVTAALAHSLRGETSVTPRSARRFARRGACRQRNCDSSTIQADDERRPSYSRSSTRAASRSPSLALARVGLREPAGRARPSPSQHRRRLPPTARRSPRPSPPARPPGTRRGAKPGAAPAQRRRRRPARPRPPQRRRRSRSPTSSRTPRKRRACSRSGRRTRRSGSRSRRPVRQALSSSSRESNQGIGEKRIFGGAMTLPVGVSADRRVPASIGKQRPADREEHRSTPAQRRNAAKRARVAAGFSDSLLATAPVASQPHPERKSVLIEANALLLADIPAAATRSRAHVPRSRTRSTRAIRSIDTVARRPRQRHAGGARRTMRWRALVAAAAARRRRTLPSPPSTLPDVRSLFLGYPLHDRHAAGRSRCTRAPPTTAIGYFTTDRLDFTSDVPRIPVQRTT